MSRLCGGFFPEWTAVEEAVPPGTLAREDRSAAIWCVVGREALRAPMIQRIKKIIGIAVGIVFGGAFTVALAYWTIKSWRDTPVFNIAFWAVIGLIAIYAGWRKRRAAKRLVDSRRD